MTKGVKEDSFSHKPVTELGQEGSAVPLHSETAKIFIPQRQESPGCEVPPKFLLLLPQGAGRAQSAAPSALQPHKHAPAPGGARAAGKDISEVSCGCNKLFKSALEHRCDLSFSILGQPAPETGNSPAPPHPTPQALLVRMGWGELSGMPGLSVQAWQPCPMGGADSVSHAPCPREEVGAPSIEMVKNKGGSDRLWDPVRSAFAGRKRLRHMERVINWKILGSSILKGDMIPWKGHELSCQFVLAFSNQCCVATAN
ncbi:uncharacterized protein LOC129041522 [Pongo pygmaeus]|uniref:uncharacterized protein LOC129041522 n=1 Tax=Pongo pygmaeus TaxID=9600 RepID=UPI000CEFE860|nr:uncharacterized protein LOC129041522 [Pongo pygmaeus]